MTDDLGVVATATAVAAVAAIGVPLPVPEPLAVLALVMALVVGSASRRPVLVAVALLVVVGSRADASVAALGVPPPERVDGVATLVSDPAPRRFGLQVVLDIDGRRYLADVPIDRAGAVRTLLTGEQVRVDGRPRDLDGAPRGWVLSRHLAGRLSVRAIEPAGRGAVWFRVANVVHRTITAGASSMGDERGPLYTGLVLGDDREQSDLMRFRFEASGLTHLLAVSGQNVAFVLAVAAPLFRRSGVSTRLVGSTVLLVLFVLVTRAEPSVLRAAVMAAVAVAAVTAGRATSGLRVLCLTVVVVLVVDPLLVHSVGFQLSVCATAGLLLAARPLADRLPGPEWLRVPLAVTLAAQLATAPLLLGLAGGLPSIAVVTNLLAGPAAGGVMMLGVTLGLLAGIVREPWAGLLQRPADAMVGWVDLVATAGSRAPAPTLGAPQVAALVVAAGLVALVVHGSRGGRRRRTTIAGSVVVAVAVAVWALWPNGPDPGRHDLGGGSVVWIGECTVVEVHGADGPGDLLDQLWQAGVRRAGLVVAGDGQRNRAAAHVVAEQLGAASVDAPGAGAEQRPGRGTDAPVRCP